MRVIHVYKEYHPVLGGIENHVRMLAEAQAAAGIDVEVLVSGLDIRSRIERIGGVRVIKAGRFGALASTPISPALFLHLRRSRADLVHLHFPYPLGELAYLAGALSRPMVMSYHSDIVRQKTLLRFYGPFLEVALRRAGRILASCPQCVQSSDYLPGFAGKIRIVPYGVELARFDNVDSVLEQDIRPAGDRPLLLFAGRLRYYKGLEYLIQAMRRVNAGLIIIGIGPMEQELRRLANELGVEDKVRFAGELPEKELVAHYHAADIFVLPSSHKSEAFGIVQLEAMACGKPVICTELGTGTSFVNLHEETGLVVRRATAKRWPAPSIG
ncbi:MAG: glycosyltransferase [Chloroflexi bacterium]|nr:glycosyltransferase [Chloroflexota bacterium]